MKQKQIPPSATLALKKKKKNTLEKNENNLEQSINDSISRFKLNNLIDSEKIMEQDRLLQVSEVNQTIIFLSYK